MNTESESICVKARRVTEERWAAERAAELAAEESFIKGLVGDEYSHNEDGSYQICERRFVYSDCSISYCSSLKKDPHLFVHDHWKGILLGHFSRIYTLDNLGQELILVDRQIERYEKHYPDTFLGRIKLWWAKDGWFFTNRP